MVAASSAPVRNRLRLFGSPPHGTFERAYPTMVFFEAATQS